jgi:hypothetical protein
MAARSAIAPYRWMILGWFAEPSAGILASQLMF